MHITTENLSIQRRIHEIVDQEVCRPNVMLLYPITTDVEEGKIRTINLVHAMCTLNTPLLPLAAPSSSLLGLIPCPKPVGAVYSVIASDGHHCFMHLLFHDPLV